LIKTLTNKLKLVMLKIMEYEITLRGLLIFETKSLLGRIFFNKKPKLNNEKII